MAEQTTPSAVARRNYLLGTLEGIIGNVSWDFLHPELILAGLVITMTGSWWLVALLAIINKGGSLLPQLYVGSTLEHKERKRPFFVALLVVRVAAVTVMFLAIPAMAGGVWLAFGAFFAAYLVWCVCCGAADVIFLDMVGRLIPLRRVGTFFGTRELAGGVLALVAGWLIIQPILDSNQNILAHVDRPAAVVASEGAAPTAASESQPLGRIADPADRAAIGRNYLVLMVIGGVLSGLAMGLLALCREVAGPHAAHRATLVESLKRGYRWVCEDSNYRAYLWLRIAFRVTYLALAFFVPFGVERLKYTADPRGIAVVAGVMLASIKASRAVSSLIWARVVDRAGDRTCLVATGIFFTLGPLLMLAAPFLPGAFSLPVPLTKVVLDLPLCVYLLALMAEGTAIQGSIIGGNRFMIGKAPPEHRISYVGFLNTVTSPLTLLPALAALVAQTLGLTALFVGIAAGGVLFWYWALRLSPDRPTDPEPGPPVAAAG